MRACVQACVRERERENECACVCVRERDRQQRDTETETEGSLVVLTACLVPVKMVSTRWEKPICAPPRLSDTFSPTLPLKQFQRACDRRWPFLILSKGDRRELPLSTPLSSRRSMALGQLAHPLDLHA